MWDRSGVVGEAIGVPPPRDLAGVLSRRAAIKRFAVTPVVSFPP